MDAMALAFYKAVLARRDALAQGAAPDKYKKNSIPGVGWCEKKHCWRVQVRRGGKCYHRRFTPKDISSEEMERALQAAKVARRELVAKHGESAWQKSRTKNAARTHKCKA